MQHFDMVLRNEKQGLYKRLSLFLLLLDTGVACWFLFFSKQASFTKAIGIISCCLLVLTLVLYVRSKNEKGIGIFFLASAVTTCLYFFLLALWLFGFITGCLFFLHFITQRNLTVIFTVDSIEYPSFPKRTINWKELSNVILKDDLLTIDFKNNHLIQQFSAEPIPSINEQEFNDFCRELLK